MTAPLAEFRSAQIAAIPALARTAALVRSDITAELIYKIIRLWTGHGPMQPQVWMHRYGEQFYTDVTLAQIEAATVAALTIDPILEEQGFTGNEDAMVEPTSLAGVDGTGRDVLGLVYAAALPLAAGLDADAPPEHTHQLWVAAGRVLQLAAHTAVLDTSRVAKGIQITGRDRAGWVRMVRPPCCARCAILAGKIGGATVGFRRHPNCDCDAVPVHDYENRTDDPTLKDWVFDTREYFDSLSAKQQSKIFTVSGARAIRDGAEPAQVINARRGMTTAKDRFGTTRRVTYESTTSRGWASRYLRQQYDAKLVKRGGRYRQTSRPRLMPEEIYEMAGGDRDKALVLLHKNGYLEGTSASLSGLGVRDAEVISAQRRAIRRLEKRGAPKSALLNAPRVIHRKAPATVIDTKAAATPATATGSGGGKGPTKQPRPPRSGGAGAGGDDGGRIPPSNGPGPGYMPPPTPRPRWLPKDTEDVDFPVPEKLPPRDAALHQPTAQVLREQGLVGEDGVWTWAKKPGDRKVQEQEKELWDWLLGQGDDDYTPRLNQIETRNTAGYDGKTPDYLVDEVPTEAKRIQSVRAFQDRTKEGRWQSREIIYDTRQSGLTREQSIEGLRTVTDKFGPYVDRLTVVGNGYTLHWPPAGKEGGNHG